MSFAVTAIAIQGTGALMGALGARNAAIGQRNALNFQAHMADLNAQSAERSAQQTLLASQQAQGRLSMKAERTKASQRVAMAANGIDMAGSDLAVNMLASTEFMRESDALTIDANATMQAEAYRAQKVNAQNDALLKRAGASSINPDMAFASSLISGASSVATSWYSMSNSGALDKGLSNWRSL